MLNKLKSQLFSRKKLFTITILIIGLTTLTNAQGITMTLGGNTANDKFIVENSNKEAGLVVTGEGNVGVGTTNPLSKLSVGGDGTGNATIYGKTEIGHNGAGVMGLATNTEAVVNYGGNFSAAGEYGNGVYGEATNSGENATNHGGYFRAHGKYGRGVYGQVMGSDGFGVFGDAIHSGNVTNYGGYFRAAGENGFGVYGEASNISGSNYGGYFKAAGSSGRGIVGIAPGSSGLGVYGYASNSGSVENYGGYFKANGSSGRAVYGIASKIGTDVTNFGGYFIAYGTGGRGVYGFAPSETGTTTNYGGYFESAGRFGRGVYGVASNLNSGTKYGVYGIAAGNEGVGVRGSAVTQGNGIANTGVYGDASGRAGIGVYGKAGFGKGVVGNGFNYDFYADGGGVDYGTSSSIRWKNNIVEIDKPLEKLAELRGVYFDWDEEHGGGHDVGCIAEEVGKVLPEIVVYEENGIDADGMDYSKLTPLLVEAVKELQQIVESQQMRIEELENK